MWRMSLSRFVAFACLFVGILCFAVTAAERRVLDAESGTRVTYLGPWRAEPARPLIEALIEKPCPLTPRPVRLPWSFMVGTAAAGVPFIWPVVAAFAGGRRVSRTRAPADPE